MYTYICVLCCKSVCMSAQPGKSEWSEYKSNKVTCMKYDYTVRQIIDLNMYGIYTYITYNV